MLVVQLAIPVLGVTSKAPDGQACHRGPSVARP
jgi:hypothetical protein